MKSARILDLGCKALADRMGRDGYPRGVNAITRSLNALALLASGNPEYLPLVRREAEWAAGFSSNHMQVWWNAHVIMLLEEEKSTEFFSRMSVASHGSERDVGHTGNFTNLLWESDLRVHGGFRDWRSELGQQDP